MDELPMVSRLRFSGRPFSERRQNSDISRHLMHPFVLGHASGLRHAMGSARYHCNVGIGCLVYSQLVSNSMFLGRTPNELNALARSVALPNPIYHQIAFASILLGGGLRCVYLFRSLPKSSDHPTRGEIKRLLYIGATVFLSGFAIWNVDNIFCNQLRVWRQAMGPLGFLLECEFSDFSRLGALSASTLMLPFLDRSRLVASTDGFGRLLFHARLTL
jgi:hypothetical protein